MKGLLFLHTLNNFLIPRPVHRSQKFFGINDATSVGLGTVRSLIPAGDDNGCFVLGGDWEIVERRDWRGRVINDSDYTPPPAGSPYATMADDLVKQVRRAAAAAKQEVAA